MPECDWGNHSEFQAHWIDYAIPDDGNNVENVYKPSQCQKYLANSSLVNGTCFKELFTRDIVDCKEWVFEEESTIVNEVRKFC